MGSQTDPTIIGANRLDELARRVRTISFKVGSKADGNTLRAVAELLELTSDEMVYRDSMNIGDISTWLTINIEDIDESYNTQLQSFLSPKP